MYVNCCLPTPFIKNVLLHGMAKQIIPESLLAGSIPDLQLDRFSGNVYNF